MTLRRPAALLASALTLALPAAAAVRSDFNRDGKADVLWRNEATGSHHVWLMKSTGIASRRTIRRELDRNWNVQAAADFTGDGRADILWRHALSGANRLWVMSSFTITRVVALPSLTDTDWRVAGASDFTGDGQADILWRHEATGENMLWPITAGVSGEPLALTSLPDLAWRVAGVGDLSGDRRADVLWRNATTGENLVWLVDGSTVVSTGSLPPLADPEWTVVDLADFDGDSKCDVLWRHGQRGDNRVWMMDGVTLVRDAALPAVPDLDWRVGMTGDVSGDRKADILWRHIRLGQTELWLMDGETRLSQATLLGGTTDPAWAVASHPPPPPTSTLFVTTLLPEGGAVTTATGTATLLLAADEASAELSLNFSGLTSDEIAVHVHGPADPSGTAPPVFSLPLGTFDDVTWNFEPTGGLSVSDQLTALKTGRMYVNVHSVNYPSGEIRGHYRAVPSSSPQPPPPNPAPPVPTTQAEARRFLEQASMGPTQALVDQVLSSGYGGFIDEQFAQPQSTYLDFVSPADTTYDRGRVYALRTRFFMNALNAPDQLRQRVAFALSQILVVSSGDIYDGPGMSVYVDLLGRNAFGNFRTLLDEITLNPAMGNYLDMVNNKKPDPRSGRTANENYARELLQLFSIGVFKLNPNGSLALAPDTTPDKPGHPVPTYEQDVIEGFARVFTGWTYASIPPNPPPTRSNSIKNYLDPMYLLAANHDTDPKEILDGVVLPGGQTGEQDLAAALDQVFNHPNVGPFIGRQLIQHLVTSNPSPGYVARVAQAFDGAGPYGVGVRGDMKAVVKAVLLDVEARRDPATVPDFGRFQDPALFATRTLRALEATGQGYGLWERVHPMGQNPFSPPSVFSFFAPDFQVPGTTLLGPPLQIFTESTAIRRANLINTIAYNTVPLPLYAPPGSTTISVDLTPWVSLAGDPAALVDDLSLRLMHGAMPADMRARIIQALSAIPATSPTTRAQAAIYLITTSAQYSVQR